MALPPEKKPSNDKAAARIAAQQDVFLREVDDALRQDQAEAFFTTYGKPLLAVLVIGLAAFGGWIYWDHHRTQQQEAQAEGFVQALDSVQASNLKDADGKLAPIAASGSDATATSARLLQAAIALQQGRKAEAVTLYGEVAADAKAPQALRDLALVRGVGADFDAMKPQDVIDRLKPLSAPGNAWFGVAGELVGMAYLKQGKPAQAGPLFAAIAKDETVDDGLRSRARQLAAVLGVDAVADVVNEQGEPFNKLTAKVVKAADAGGQ